jgi:hypothetical protein
VVGKASVIDGVIGSMEQLKNVDQSRRRMSTCAICLEPLSSSTIELRCGHVFDAHCIFSSCLHAMHHTPSFLCPLCRTPALDHNTQQHEDNELERDRSRIREHERLVRRGMRLVNQNKACPAVQRAVTRYRHLRVKLGNVAQQDRELDREVRAYMRQCRSAISELRRYTPTDITSRVDIRFYKNTHRPRYWALFHELIRARRAIAETVALEET